MEEKNKDTKEITLDDLALMIAQRFNDIDEKMESGFKEMHSDIKNIQADVSELKTDVAIIKTDVEDIRSTMGNLEANLNKKVDKVNHNTLIYRVEKLEEKLA